MKSEIIDRRMAAIQARIDARRVPLKAPRDAFPICRAFVAELRDAGLNPRLTYASEAGMTVGEPDSRDWVPFSLPHRKAKKPSGLR